MKKHKDRYSLAFSNGDKPTIYGHSYFWTNQGLKVQFAQYEVAPFAFGAPTISIPEKFLKVTLP
jgi:hypothetical protein